MTKVVTVEQMRRLEEAAVAAGTSERELMHNAGVAAAQEAWMAVGAMEGRPILALIGPGKNGGDGLVAVRQLAEWGAAVHAYLLRPRPDDDPEWRAVADAGIATTTAEEDDETLERLDSLLDQAALVLDSLLGTGQRPRERPIEGALAQMLRRLAVARGRNLRPQLVAVDLPTGVDAGSGYADPLTVAADITVTFGYPKVGHVTPPGRTFAGRVEPVDIGLPPAAAADMPFEEIRLRDVKASMPARPEDGHKGTFGTVVVAGGSRKYPGAIRLAAEAVLRSGAGLVTIAAPEAVQPLLVHGLPDATHEPLPSTDGALDADAARELVRALRQGRPRALLVGPGLTASEPARAFVQHLLAGLDQVDGLEGLVLDADALNLLAEEPGWHSRLAVPRVLTPHPGEMSRLMRRTVDEVQANRLGTALAYAQATDSVVVLKGAGTVVASPDGRARISAAANAMLAHGGTGDVLAGLIAGLIAQGMTAFDAASAAVYLHAETGRLVAEAYGTAGGIASDLLRALPESRKLLEETR
ncbi:MAG: NAD(P)H-hydrate dehydratase [Dehalococcoidia bacterium]|nr:NAD(P)H-hydrate dehydratase [Dehalococcoidia bacterium]